MVDAERANWDYCVAMSTSAERMRRKRERDKASQKASQIPADVTDVTLPECPREASEEQWNLCFERAVRAIKYAEKFPDHVFPSEIKYQDPLWQWENEVKGRARPPERQI